MSNKEPLPLLEFEGFVCYEYIIIHTLEKLFDTQADFHKILEFSMLALSGKRDLETAFMTSQYFVKYDHMSKHAIMDIIKFEKSIGTD